LVCDNAYGNADDGAGNDADNDNADEDVGNDADDNNA